MKLTKERCIRALNYILNERTVVAETVGNAMIIEKLINEHFELIKAIEFIFGVKSEDVLKEYEEMEF